MFMCHYVIIPFRPQYLPRHAPQGAGIQGAGIGDPKPALFLYSNLNLNIELNFDTMLTVCQEFFKNRNIFSLKRTEVLKFTKSFFWHCKQVEWDLNLDV